VDARVSKGRSVAQELQGTAAAGRVWFLLSSLLLCLAGVLLAPLAVAAIYGEGRIVQAFLSTILLCAIVGISGVVLFRSSLGTLSRREGFAVVGLGWMLVCLAGSLPFVFSHTLGFVDALFECVSGMTGTGASVIPNIEGVARGIVFWRSFTHWLGGMGFVVLYIAVFPLLGVGAMQLYQAEAPGPEKDKVTPRIRDTARVMWLIYIGLSAVLTVLLLAGGMNLFDALCHTFGAIGTGGFSTRNASVGAYHSAYIEWVILIFLFLAATNFSLYYFLLRGKPMRLFKDPEWRFFTSLVVGISLICTILVMVRLHEPFSEALRHGVFSTVSTITTTGYVTADFEKWPYLAQFLLVLCLFPGGSAGSTAGAMKSVRVLILLKHVKRQLGFVIHPRMVSPIRLGERVLSVAVIRGVLAFIGLYLTVFVISVAGMSLVGLDFTTAVTAVATCMAGCGPGLADVGPTDTYAFIHPAGKLLLSFCMLAGRLELYTVLLLFTPRFWRR
jgi:trk system potassium uptake protein TrkH